MASWADRLRPWADRLRPWADRLRPWADRLRNPRVRLASGLLAILFLGVASYGFVLSLGLIGSDTIPLIAESQADGFEEVVDALTRPLMGGRNRAVEFYRPVVQALFLIETRLFGLEPQGYQAISLLAHLLCALAIALLGYVWTGSPLVASLSGAIFVIHPTAVATVPFPARVQDVLACLFGLGALLAHQGVLRRTTPGKWIAVGLLAALAMLAKEMGLLFSGLIVLSHWLRGPGTPVRRVAVAVGWLAPIVLPALIARLLVLGGVGGYQVGTLQMEPLPAAFASSFFVDQRTPVGFVLTFFQVLLDPTETLGRWGAALVALPLLGLLALVKDRRMVLILLAWLVGMLCPYLYLRFAHEKWIPLVPWYLYSALPPASLLLALAVVRGVRGPLWRRALVGAAGFLLAVELIRSPLVRSYPSLQVGSSLQDTYFESLDRLVRTRASETATLRPGPMPFSVVGSVGFAPGTMMFVGPYTVEAWMDVVHPQTPASVRDPKLQVPDHPRDTLRIWSKTEWVKVDDHTRALERAAVHWKRVGRSTLTEAEPTPGPDVETLEEGVRRAPTDARAWLALGEARRLRNELRRAEIALKNAIERDSNLWEAHYALGQVYGSAGRLRRAEGELLEVLRVRPAFLPAQEGLELVRKHFERPEDPAAPAAGPVER